MKRARYYVQVLRGQYTLKTMSREMHISDNLSSFSINNFYTKLNIIRLSIK